MRRNMFAVAAVALLAMVAAPVSMADAPYPTVKKLTPIAICTAKTAEVDAKGIMRILGAKCTTVVKTKDGNLKLIHILAKVTKVVYTSKDAQGDQCGKPVTKVNTGRFRTFPLGATSMAVTVTVVPRNKRFKQQGKKIYKLQAKIAPSSATAVCGETRQNTPLSDPLALCPGLDFKGCGSPINPATGRPAPEASAWVTVPSRAGNVISAGWFVFPSPSCWIQPLSGKPSFPWLGSIVSMAEGRCSDGTHVEIALYRVELISPSGQSCGPYVPPFVEIASFTIPASWGPGSLKVIWGVETTKNGASVGVAGVTAEFNLTGNVDGCPQLRAESRT